MHRLGTLFLGLLVLGGCAKVDKLLTLQSLSANQDAQRRDVEAQNKQFQALLAAIEENRLQEYLTQESFVKAFGEPILIKKVTQDGKLLDQWLYRYAHKLMGPEKVYAYFDESGKYLRFDHVIPPQKAEETKEKN